jgi:hypothetical protein
MVFFLFSSSSSSSFLVVVFFFFFVSSYLLLHFFLVVVSFLHLFLSSTFSLTLFSYVEIPLFLGNFQEGSTEIETEKKKKKPSIHNFFADNLDQDIEI